MHWKAKEPTIWAENGVVAELGIGTNDEATLSGVILEDEKLYGTVHVAFGTNTSFGGTNKADCHYDGIILKPTLYLDDELIIDKGRFVPTSTHALQQEHAHKQPVRTADAGRRYPSAPSGCASRARTSSIASFVLK